MSALPVPTGYHLLVQMVDTKEITSGGIYLPQERKKLEDVANIVAKVLVVGPDAYKDDKRFPNGPWCKEGDFVILRSYSGTRFKVGDDEFRLINDDTVEAVTDAPQAIERAA